MDTVSLESSLQQGFVRSVGDQSEGASKPGNSLAERLSLVWREAEVKENILEIQDFICYMLFY